MYWTLAWQSVLIILLGTMLLRIAGRKSISQMTISQTVIMIGLGALLIEPVTGKGFWPTFYVGGVLVATLVVLEYLQVKTDLLERLFTGRAKLVIENGQILEQNLAKMRLTVDHLEMRLRQAGISSVDDVKTATLEVSGEIGYELKEEKLPATKEDLQKLQALIERMMGQTLNQQAQSPSANSKKHDIFTEVREQGHQVKPPKHLQ